MAKQKSEQAMVQVIEKNEGTKIPFEQDEYYLDFDDGAISLKLTKYQKDWPVSIDICNDKIGNLTISTDNGLRYVAQIAIPAIEYIETIEGDEVTREAKPLNMSDVVLTLWSID